MVLGIAWTSISSIPGFDPFMSAEDRNLYRGARFLIKSILSAAIMYMLCSELRMFTEDLGSKDATSVLLILDGASSNIIGAVALFLRDEDGEEGLEEDERENKITQLRQMVATSGELEPADVPSKDIVHGSSNV